MNKSQLRKIYTARQKNLSPFETKQKSDLIADGFFREFDLSRVQILHCFIAIEKFNEIDTTLIFKRLWENYPQIETLVPRVDFQNGEIENLNFTIDTKLKNNIWQIKEPLNDEMIETKEIDLILVPLLCFDEKGFRVGYGKGFYDKLLKNCRNDCLKIGLSFFEPTEKIADVENFDVKLDFCVTPEKVWRFFS